MKEVEKILFRRFLILEPSSQSYQASETANKNFHETQIYIKLFRCEPALLLGLCQIVITFTAQ